MQQAMPGTAGKRIVQTLRKHVGQGWCIGIRRHPKVAVRGQQRRE